MGHKLIFLDIDGTLTEPGCNVPPESAQKAVQEARKKGNYVFLCTGRNYDMLRPVLEYGFDGAIASSGGYIIQNNEIIYDCPMTENQKNKALELFKKNGVFRTVECRNSSYTDEEFKEFLKEHAQENGNSEFLRWREQIEKSLNIRPMKEYENQPVYKIVFMCTDEKQLEEPIKELSDDFMFCIQGKNEHGIINGELVNKKFDKGQAIRRVCEHLGILLEDTIAYGDSMNDKEMFEICAISVCMENGNEEMKKLAADVCPSVTEDGIWKSFQKYHLIDHN